MFGFKASVESKYIIDQLAHKGGVVVDTGLVVDIGENGEVHVPVEQVSPHDEVIVVITAQCFPYLS